METEDTCQVHVRLQRLEREAKTARALAVLLGLFLCILFGTGQRGRVQTVEAERFVRKKDGIYYGEMGFSPSGSPVVVVSPGNAKAVEGLPETNGGFYLIGKSGQASVHLGHDGGATVQVGSPQLMSVISEGRFMVYEKNNWKWGAP